MHVIVGVTACLEIVVMDNVWTIMLYVTEIAFNFLVCSLFWWLTVYSSLSPTYKLVGSIQFVHLLFDFNEVIQKAINSVL